jgi:hypothetical protein
MYGATVRSESSRETAVGARRAEAPTVLPRPQVVVVQGGIKSSGLAAVLSFFWCGLGHIYLGHFGTGIALMIGYPVVLWFGFGLMLGGALVGVGGAAGLGSIFLLIALVMWIFGMTKAYRTAERMNEHLARY